MATSTPVHLSQQRTTKRGDPEVQRGYKRIVYCAIWLKLLVRRIEASIWQWVSDSKYRPIPTHPTWFQWPERVALVLWFHHWSTALGHLDTHLSNRTRFNRRPISPQSLALAWWNPRAGTLRWHISPPEMEKSRGPGKSKPLYCTQSWSFIVCSEGFLFVRGLDFGPEFAACWLYAALRIGCEIYQWVTTSCVGRVYISGVVLGQPVPGSCALPIHIATPWREMLGKMHADLVLICGWLICFHASTSF